MLTKFFNEIWRWDTTENPRYLKIQIKNYLSWIVNLEIFLWLYLQVVPLPFLRNYGGGVIHL
jgi:hypothetical protein